MVGRGSEHLIHSVLARVGADLRQLFVVLDLGRLRALEADDAAEAERPLRLVSIPASRSPSSRSWGVR